MLRPAITTGLAALELPATPAQIAQLAHYLDLLARWNRGYNLTAVRDPVEMVSRHLLDSLAVVPWLQGSRIVDVGSGAGLPGLPLAVMHPALQFTLLDSHAKKTRFMTQTCAELALQNAHVIRARVEQYYPAQRFDCILARAVAPLSRLLEFTGHLCAPNSRLLALKGSEAHNELQQLPAAWRVRGCHRLQVPGLDAERWLLHLEPSGPATHQL